MDSFLVPVGVILVCMLVAVGAGWPTLPLRARRMFAFGPALAWVTVALTGFGFAVVLTTRSQTRTTLSAALAFFALGAWSVARVVKASREAISDPLEPLFQPRQPSMPRQREPLTADEEKLAREWFSAFQAAKLIDPSEVSISEVLEYSEHDEQCPYNLRNFLNALSSCRQQYEHLTFFFDSVEFSTEDAIDIVMEFARLADRQVRDVELQHAGPIREDRGQESTISFNFDGQRHHVRFTMYAKALPWELIDDLRDRIRPAGDERRFAVAWAESLAMVTFVSGDQREVLDRLMGAELFAEGS